MDFLNYLEESASDINSQLENIFNDWRDELKALNIHVLKLLELSIDASTGGKRLRGTLVKLGYEIAGAGLTDDILVPAAAYEIFQTAILAHDDIIDKSPLRRGKPTIYASLGANHYATSQTICLGDIGFFLAYKLIASSSFNEQEKIKAIESFSKTMIDTAFGEILDVELPYLKKEKDEEDIIAISRYKTAWYTVVGPLQLGASLAGSGEDLLKNIKDFGENLGIAYQIQDDILGVFGSEKELGKSVTSDIEEGKNTILLIKALEGASIKQQEYFKNHYGQGEISFSELDEFKKIFVQTDALEYARKKAEEYVQKAKQLIPQITKNDGHRQLLEEMAEYLIKRTK